MQYLPVGKIYFKIYLQKPLLIFSHGDYNSFTN